MMGLKSFSFCLSLLGPFSIFQNMIQGMNQWEKRWGFKNFDLPLVIIYWPLSIFQDLLKGRWWVWNLFLFCNCWLQPFRLLKSLLCCEQGAQEWTCYPTNFSFQWQGWLKIQYVPHFKSKNYEITSVKSHTLRAFQQYQDSTLISLNCIVFSSLNFQWKTLYNIQ